MKKRIFSILLILLLCALCSFTAVAETSTESQFLYDNGDLLSESEELALQESLKKVSETHQAQLVIATMDTLEDLDIDEFVEFAYDTWGLGYGENHDGVLLLVCMDPREYRILSNGFAAEAISMDDIEDISSAIESDLSEGDYAAAFNTFIDKCDYQIDGHLNGFPFAFGKNLLIALGIGLVVALIVTGSMKAKLKSVQKQRAATQYTKPGSMQVTLSNDFFLYRTVSRQEKPQSSSSSSSSGSSRNVGGGKF